jgi:hypothetical protein
MDVDVLPDAQREPDDLPPAERVRMLRAIEKLKLFGIKLPHPWTSHVEGTDLWELRPVAGHSPWRGIYKRVGDVLRVAAIGPDAKVDKHAFIATVKRAATRLGSQ